MAELPKPGKGKTTWIVVGVAVVVLLWFLAKRGSGPTVIPGSGGAPAVDQGAAAQGLGALASVASAQLAAEAQLESIRAEAAAYLNGQTVQANAATAAADRYASAQNNAYVWGTIRDIGVTAIPYIFGGGHQPPSIGGGTGFGNPNMGGVAI